MDGLTIVDHPILKRDLTVLRRKETPHGLFRSTVSDAAAILAYEAMRSLAVEECSIETPLEQATGFAIADDVIVIPILRAGLGMVDGFIRFIPEARVGHLGMQRDEDTKAPVGYYSNIPEGLDAARLFVVDPMLATGGSARRAIEYLKDEGARDVTFVCVLAAPEGVRTLSEAHPDVPIVTAALDRTLDEHAFIRPGLGDAGDRIFGTTS